ncbi:PAS domain S-box protein [Desulforhopalus vacuolatus]|nr:PAS domain S-box protein [Desulforhopalus vacuolatus]
MWWLWYSDGWGILYAVPVFTLWIIWHGFWSDYRRHNSVSHWYLSSFAVEIPFRIFIELGFYTIFCWLVTLNPPPWDSEITNAYVPLSWCHTIAIKHTITACILLLAVYVTLSIGPIRRFFGLSRKTAQQDITTIYAGAILIGILFIGLDGMIGYIFQPMNEKNIWHWIVLDVNPHSVFMRFCYIIIMIFGAAILSRMVQNKTILNERLVHLNRVLHGIRDVNKLIIKENDKSRLLREVCRIFIEARGYHRVWIGNIKEGKLAAPYYHAGFDLKFSEFETYIESGTVPFCIEKIIAANKLYMMHMPCNKCKGCPLARSEEEAAMMAVPLAHSGMLFGYICVVVPSLFFQDKEEQTLFEEVAEDISFALWSIEMENRNQTLEESYSSVLAASIDAIMAIDLEGTITLFSSGAEHLFGWKADEILGKSITRICPDEFQNEAKELIQKVLKEGNLKGVEVIRQTSSGQHVAVEMTLNLRRDRQGKAIGVFGILRDITERNKARVLAEKLQQAQKMEAIGTLSGGVAHDFNNILFPIIGHTEMLLDDIPPQSPFRESLQEIYTSALRAKKLVQQILTFSRQNNSEVKLIKIQPVIKEALKLIRSTIPTTIEIVQDIRSDCGVIKADPTQIHQIIMNLTTNAYHAMEKTGGKMKISLNEIELDKQDIINMEPGTYLCLTVADTGIGMDKELKEKIFNPFFTTKEKGKGTGLGLSVVHGIVTSAGGNIYVYSEPGKGSEFHLYFPRVENSFEKEKNQEKPTIQRGTEHILLVDDEEVIIKMEKRLLERLGYQVTSRTSSIDALEAFKAHPDTFDGVITDFAMPNMAGDKLAIELIKIRPDIPILLCTGFSENMSEEKAISMGINGFLMKPFMTRQLSKKIRDMFDEKKSVQE